MGELIELNNGELTVYRADPRGEVRGGLIVIHEVWGLVEHITDVADRFAAQGYLVIAPDILTHGGIPPQVGAELQRLMTADDEESRTKAQPMLREAMAPINVPEYAQYAVGALRSVVDFLEQQPGVNGHIAVTGFCFGGGYSFALAAADQRVKAAIPFYGMAPSSTDVTTIACPVLALYGQNDPRLIDNLPALTATMADAGVAFESTVYEGAGHAFFNDSNAHAYNADAAADAWSRTLSFLEAHI